MSVKTFGIYLAYGPRVDLRTEGLGRHLAEFLKASTHFENVRFVIAAPRWLRSPLKDLLENFDLDFASFELVSPKHRSLLGLLYGLRTAVSVRRTELRRKLGGKGYLRKTKNFVSMIAKSTVLAVAKSRNPFTLLVTIVIGIAAIPIAAVVALFASVMTALIRTFANFRPQSRFIKLKRHLNRGGLFTRVSHSAYQFMCDSEASAVADEANKRRDVEAWYAPAAFWPEFNRIKAPRLMCVPDVVPIHFPVGFAIEEPNGDRRMQDFKRIEAAIDGGDRFVTYSSDVKNRTLVERFHVEPGRVSVIPHGANRLDRLITVSGFPDDEAATDTLSAQHFWGALSKTVNNNNATWYASKDLGFLFYASQFRPNKNVMNLLRAYDHLRRTQNIPYKLLMTGEWRVSGSIVRFMDENRLHNDVLFVRGLSERELASCYRLATLAVNPSLAEGGMPFTFTEAVSVGTPVIMADIPVSREIIQDVEVAQRTFFDGFDYRSIAKAITSALADRDGLVAAQRDFYNRQMVTRSWNEVVREYILVLESMGEEPH
ncbi:glycosyltransferase [Mesorhizobium opportunistum]|uniref:Glycosyltransferase n=1 Tax=Mesorhizobium opportunistum TaxID=593909 RepID=A0ABV1YQP6_9HYPH|nr:glycosyltransferase [Mesorhizobium sp.]TIN92199.1 MAG: glycosyltransferase family 4 protein [Mesorhizobium sp.]TJU96217.1 MAG: glycosyltransferase family 4 protein [Mesorhizobium sp.]TJV15452.1 MAG: glycosyltransferase family 4 protein [Mesorhizobium sp.]